MTVYYVSLATELYKSTLSAFNYCMANMSAGNSWLQVQPYTALSFKKSHAIWSVDILKPPFKFLLMSIFIYQLIFLLALQYF